MENNPKSQAYVMGDAVDVNFGVNGYHDDDIIMGNAPLTFNERYNGMGGVGRSPSDINNNAPESARAQNGTLENDETENEVPHKGNVAAKVAYLTEIVFPALPPEPRNPPRKGTVPMPGLVSKSPTDISDEISKYNAKSLAVGELSHSSNTLYRGGVPQRISDIHPGPKGSSDSVLDAELVGKLKAARDRSDSIENAGTASIHPPTHPFIHPSIHSTIHFHFFVVRYFIVCFSLNLRYSISLLLIFLSFNFTRFLVLLIQILHLINVCLTI
jgi:hypothetical protein